VSKAEFDQRRAARDVAEADVQTAEEALRIARSGARVEDVEAMEARIRGVRAQLRKAKDDLADSSLRAPYAGMVAERYVDNFEYVQAREEILSLQNIEIMELVAQIPETVIAGYEKGSFGNTPDFIVTFPSLPDQRLKAKVSEIATEADRVTRTYSVVFQVPQPSRGLILAGMTGEVSVTDMDDEEGGYIVPSAAVFNDETGQSAVWKLTTSNTVTRQEVELGEMSAASVMLVSGVSRGDKIVTAGANFLEEGQQVREIVSELRERR
jgi:RND family efflux transporter MFP subunit